MSTLTLEKAKEILGTCDYSTLFANYESLKKISFDYAVAEHEKDIKGINFSAYQTS